MTERDIQLAIYQFRRRRQKYPLIFPNVCIWKQGNTKWEKWESDLVYVSDSFYATEFEIKLTRSDFKADLKKPKHLVLAEGHIGPKHFYYVCPQGPINACEVPSYAGLLYVYTNNFDSSNAIVRIVKKAPARKVEPLTDDELMLLLKKGLSRYWKSEISREKKRRS